MIYRIVSYCLLGMCILAFFLATIGVTQIEFGDSYYSWLKSVQHIYDSWNFEVPNIPDVPTIPLQESDTKGVILKVLVKFVNFFVKFVNILVSIINVLVFIINIVIHVIQFIISIIISCRDFINRQGSIRFAYV